MGKKRPVWRTLVLGLGTLGIYGLYWFYKAHAELCDRFQGETPDVDRETLWFVLGILLAPFFLVYLWKFVADVNRARETTGLSRSLSAFWILVLVASFGFLGGILVVRLQIPTWQGYALAVLGWVLAVASLQADINEVWSRLDEQGEIAGGPAA